MRKSVCLLAAAGALLVAAAMPTDTAFPAWAFPSGPGDHAVADRIQTLMLPGSAGRFTRAEIGDLYNAVDWSPEAHPPMPAVVAHGHPPGVRACGYCHMPAGEGRPENATLAGLPRDYIVAQVRHFAGGERRSARGDWLPTRLMAGVAAGATDSEVAQAADYYSRLPFASRLRVIETANLPRPTVARFLLVRGSGAPDEPIGERIVEEPVSLDRFEMRAPAMDYVAYVPPGSLARGAALAGGAGGTQACSSCHGARLRGDIGPPLAGRSPSYLFRQLYAFHTGARSGPDAAAMSKVTARLSPADMIALAAYAGAQRTAD